MIGVAEQVGCNVLKCRDNLRFRTEDFLCFLGGRARRRHLHVPWVLRIQRDRNIDKDLSLDLLLDAFQRFQVR